MKWSEQTIPERVATLQREYERRAKELYPDGVPMEAYKKEPMRHVLSNPSWSGSGEYRIKPEPKPEKQNEQNKYWNAIKQHRSMGDTEKVF